MHVLRGFLKLPQNHCKLYYILLSSTSIFFTSLKDRFEVFFTLFHLFKGQIWSLFHLLINISSGPTNNTTHFYPAVLITRKVPSFLCLRSFLGSFKSPKRQANLAAAILFFYNSYGYNLLCILFVVVCVVGWRMANGEEKQWLVYAVTQECLLRNFVCLELETFYWPVFQSLFCSQIKSNESSLNLKAFPIMTSSWA